MSVEDRLEHYRRKRNFALTSEPATDPAAGQSNTAVEADSSLRFVIQKHWASRLHYDLRLELDGTMKSWAVPKGPSLDSTVKRMAVQVEDHPIAYSSFEGTIPARQYGAGKVIVWDQGTWQPLGDAQRGLAAGHLKFGLRGQKLRGQWALVRIASPRSSERQPPWLLIKKRDAFARASAEFSVVDEQPERVTTQPAARSSTGLPPAGASKSELPGTLTPQLASLADLAKGPPLHAQDWLCEIKFDGYRLLSRVDATGIRLFTRNGNDWTAKLSSLRAALAALKLPPGWYDGELVLPGQSGVPDFGALQRAFEPAGSKTGAQASADSLADDTLLYLFDLPYCDGHDLRQVPIEVRRALLQEVLGRAHSDRVRFSQAFDGPLPSLMASACKLGLEGLIAKRRGSAYVSQRSRDWIKLKCQQRQAFVIGGYSEPQGSRSGLGALLLGVHDDAGALQFVGKVGTGFSQAMLGELKRRLDALAVATCPFAPDAVINGKAHWVRPSLVAEVSFAEWTRGGRLRAAVFHALRSDKQAHLVVRNLPLGAQGRVPLAAGPEAAKPAPLRIHVTHPQRVIDTRSAVTKIELVRYYGLVGELMMEHLAGRPVSLLRAPDGVEGKLFFQKHADTRALPGVRPIDARNGHPALLQVAAKQGLLSAAQWNVIEFHTANHSSRAIAKADRMVFDLDPGADVPWPQVQDAAELVHAFLQQLGLNAFLKTSGGKGLHLVVPLRRVHEWASVKGFAQAVVTHLARTVGQRFVARSGPKNRVGKIFIDYLRNGAGATTVCAWSARARPGMGISVPLAWPELRQLKAGDHWTVRTAHARLNQGNAPWQGYAQAACSLTAAMRMLNYKPR